MAYQLASEEAPAVGLIDVSSGAATRVSNDLNSYVHLSMTTGGDLAGIRLERRPPALLFRSPSGKTQRWTGASRENDAIRTLRRGPDGGAIFTDDDEIAARLRSIRLHGAGTELYTHERLGITGRLDTIQAAVLNVKLTVFDDEVERRLAVAARYDDELADLVKPPATDGGTVPVWAQYTIKVDDRDAVQQACKEAGVPTAVYYPIPLSQQTGYRGYPQAPQGVPVSEALSQRVLSLPMHPYLNEGDQRTVIEAVTSAVAGESR